MPRRPTEQPNHKAETMTTTTTAPKTDRQIAEETAARNVAAAKTRLILDKDAKSVFFATLALRLEYKPNWPTETATIDGRTLRYNPEYVNELTEPQAVGLIAHEVMHCAGKHFARRCGRDLAEWNEATDLAINGTLLASGFTLPDGFIVPGIGPYSDFPTELSAEEYFALIQARKEPEPQPEDAPDDDQEEQPQDDQANDDDQEETDDEPADDGDDTTEDDQADDQEDDTAEDGDETEEDSDDDGSPADDGDETAEDDQTGGDSDETADDGDDETDGDTADDGDQPADEETADPGRCGGVIDAPADESPQQLDAAWSVNIAAAQQAAERRGSLSAGLARLCGEALAPAADWKAELREFINRPTKTDYNWKRPNRRHIHRRLYLPSLHSLEIGHIVAMIDTSGSISEATLTRFASELADIATHGAGRITILYHDSAVVKVETWTPDDGVLTLTPCGGGGTDHCPCFDWIEQNCDELPDVVIGLTDMLSEFPADAPAFPVLWASTRQNQTPPFGEITYIPAA
jgi:predicted metal-dependent peptidase